MTLLVFGMSFDTQGPRIRAAELMVRNNDSSKLFIFCGVAQISNLALGF